MSLIKWNNLFDKPVTRWFDHFLERKSDDFSGNWNGAIPAVNVSETKDEYQVEVAVPGMKKEDFKIHLDNDVLTISGEKENKKEEQQDNYMRQEFNYASFQRSFHLPNELVEMEKIDARYKNGMLKITIPKNEQAKITREPRQIAISS